VDTKGDDNVAKQPRLYYELAGWFHLLTAPEDYREEAAFYARLIKENSRIPVMELLEMGSGGGNNASNMKANFTMTLTDLSNDMLAISEKLNPECEHVQGDMRSLRLDRQFDAVFVQDAISYLTREIDLVDTLKTAYIHCRPGGAVLFSPDYVRESFQENTRHGGHSRDGRHLRYLEWTHDPDPGDTQYLVDMAYVMDDGKLVNCHHDRHRMGLFPRDTWLRLMKETGFNAVKGVPYPHRSDGYYATPIFVGVKPG
jgi:SAM-dependent methyltransferase